MKPYYVTTPIYYVNDRPHIGHCYTTLLADVVARFQRLVRGAPTPTGPDASATPEAVFFLTGTDEHADKVSTAAAERGLTPVEWADQNAEAFQQAFGDLGFSHDDFIRTTQARHTSKVPGYLRELVKAGDVYKGDYEGWYDEGQEEYVPENEAREHDYKSPISGRPLVKRTEQNYFFRLSAYADWLRERIESDPGFIRPEARRNEVLGRIKQGLNDVPISRAIGDTPPGEVWGVLMPDDPEHRVYVWIDALFNYLTAVDEDGRRAFWPAEVHMIGKDILWFHAVIWPCMLHALEKSGAIKDRFPGGLVPGCVYAHGWWISEGRKMSKSMGNFIDLAQLKAYADRYSLDALRWYLVTQGPLGATDADFAHAKFVEVYNADLANGIGNSASRVGNMIAKYFDGKVPSFDGQTRVDIDEGLSSDVAQECKKRFDLARDHFKIINIAIASQQAMELVSYIDHYIAFSRPFSIAKQIEGPDDPKQRELESILYRCAEALRIASVLLSPVMPEKMDELWRNWNCAPPAGAMLEDLCTFGGPHALKPGQLIAKGEALFMRADPDEPKPGAGG